MDFQIIVRGKAIKAVKTLQQISGEGSEEALLNKALRLYEEILAEQVKGSTIVSERPDGTQSPLIHLVKDEVSARAFFARKKRRLFVPRA